MNLIVYCHFRHHFFATEAVFVCKWQFELSMSYNAPAMRKGEYFLGHSAYIVPRVAYLRQASEGHQRLLADHGDQPVDHCQEPVINC